jgi:hypothetical protein
MKIFEIRTGEKEWVAAHTNIQALRLVYGMSEVNLGDYSDDDEIVEIPESEWPNHSISFGDRSETFEEYMKHVTEPEYLAATMY